MKAEEFIDGKLVRTRTLKFDQDISNCLKELEAAGIEVMESHIHNGVYWVTGNAGRRFDLYNDANGRPKMHIHGQCHENIADFKHLVMNVCHHQWRTEAVKADPPWRTLFLRFGFVREGENGVLIPVG